MHYEGLFKFSGLYHIRNPFPLPYTLNLRGVIWWLCSHGCCDPLNHAEDIKYYQGSVIGCEGVDTAIRNLQIYHELVGKLEIYRS